MYNMMGSPYAMLEADVMVYAQPYKVCFLWKGLGRCAQWWRASMPGCLLVVWRSGFHSMAGNADVTIL
jgi:hypothetical protein